MGAGWQGCQCEGPGLSTASCVGTHLEKEEVESTSMLALPGVASSQGRCLFQNKPGSLEVALLCTSSTALSSA